MSTWLSSACSIFFRFILRLLETATRTARPAMQQQSLQPQWRPLRYLPISPACAGRQVSQPLATTIQVFDLGWVPLVTNWSRPISDSNSNRQQQGPAEDSLQAIPVLGSRVRDQVTNCFVCPIDFDKSNNSCNLEVWKLPTVSLFEKAVPQPALLSLWKQLKWCKNPHLRSSPPTAMGCSKVHRFHKGWFLLEKCLSFICCSSHFFSILQVVMRCQERKVWSTDWKWRNGSWKLQQQ